MADFKTLKRELPFGSVVIYGGIIYAGMLLVLNAVLLLIKSGFPVERIFTSNADISFMLLSLFIGLFTMIFVIFTILVPKVIMMYPVVGYYYTFIKDNRKVKILPQSNKEKYINLLKNWAKVVGAYVALGMIEGLYLLILFGSEVRSILVDIFSFSSILLSGVSVSFLGTLVFTFSLVIAGMIQNIYKIKVWKVVVSYIFGYVFVYIGRALVFNTENIMLEVFSSSLYTINSYMIITGIIYLMIFIGELVWTIKNINRIKVA